MNIARTLSIRFALVVYIAAGLSAGCFDSLPGVSPDDSNDGSPTRPPTQVHEQTVEEGEVVLLIAVDDGVDGTTGHTWRQISGPIVRLGDVIGPSASFVAPQVDTDEVLVFEYFASDDFQVYRQYAVVLVTDVPEDAPPLCANASCEPGKECDADTGLCVIVDPCAGVSCDDDFSCDEGTGACVPVGACGTQTCAADERCDVDAQQCEPTCTNVACGSDERLDVVTCSCAPADPCQGVTCASGEMCDPATGLCVTDASCTDPPSHAVFAVASTSIGTTEFSLTPDYWIEFDTAVDAATFSDDSVKVTHAGSDNVWGTPDDTVVSAVVQLDCCTRLNISLGVQLIGGRYRVTLKPGCLRATAGGSDLGLDGEFNGLFPSGNGQFGGDFVQEFIGVAPGTYSSQSLCQERTEDILGRVTNEDVFYDDAVVVTGDGDLLYEGRPIRPGESMSPAAEGFDLTMTVQYVSFEGSSWHTIYDVVGTMDGFAFDGPQDESYTFKADGTIAHAGASSFVVRSNFGVVVADFSRTCSATLRQ